MATNNQLNVGLSGASGTGSFAGTTSPTFVTPIIGAATSTTVVFSPTTGGIIGTTTNNDTSAGNVGEFISSVIPFASATALTNVTAKNVTSISLTAGDWDVWGNVGFGGGGTTTVNTVIAWTGSTSATLPDPSLYNEVTYNPASAAFAVGAIAFQVPTQRFSLSGTTTVYLSAYASFAVSTCTAYGGIYARRRR